MNTLLGLLAETPSAAEQPRVTPIREQVQRPAVSSTPSVNDGQIRALVQQLFFRRESKPVRHVGFVPIEASTETATLCLEVARVLAEEDRYDVGLIDAHPDSVPLQTKLQIPSHNRAEASWPMAPRLWMVPRQSWLPDPSEQRIAEQNLSRLRELTTEFDFSILWCAPASWLTASIGQTCDGLVLVLAANKTRRLVAAQIKDQLGKAQVPLLGTVLAERRFPVPQGLYRSL
ncbi:MAG: hypothetical protein ABSA80_13180 [Terriglobales bacterium]